MANSFWRLIITVLLALPLAIQSRAQAPLNSTERTDLKLFIKNLSGARAQALEVREKYFCLDSKSNNYVQGTITEFDGIQNGTDEGWTVIHRITGCHLRQMNLNTSSIWALNFLWESYELLFKLEPLEIYKRHNSEVANLGKMLSATIKGYLQDTKKDVEAIFEGYQTDGKQCTTRFTPPTCFTKEELQRMQIGGERIVTQEIPSLKEDSLSKFLDWLGSAPSDQTKKNYRVLKSFRPKVHFGQRATM